MPKSITVVAVADREADIYDFLATQRPENSQLLIGAYHNRQVKNSDGEEVERIQSAIGKIPLAGQISLELRANPQRSARTAMLNLQATTVEILPPQSHLGRQNLQPLRVQVILACEENPPATEQPVSWLLLTTLPITGVEDIVECLRWYSYRWLIERYHYVLKSGCSLEQVQLETADRIERALSTYTIVAWR
ncbi:IS4 family transposase [Microcoleus sp. F4-D5]|uniref:IS4 family transposase n=1 Tax=Microcoleus sp. F4-D5 TaxID=2818760 RepID=UPI002FD5C8D3